MDRRGFLKFAAGGTVGIVASPIIWNTLYDAVYWSQNWGWIPRLQDGENQYLPTVSKLCPSGTGIRIRLVGGRPVRALGDPANPISKGALTALAAAETQLMVSEARLKRPLRRGPDGNHVAISWDEAETLLKQKTEAAQGSLACISGDPTSTINEVFSGLLNALGSTDFYLMPGEEQPALKAWSLMGGQGRLGYDIERSDFVLAIGANVLETWGTVARNRRAFRDGRPAGEDSTLKFAYAGPVQNNTASGADWWLPIKPGTEGILALGIANLLIASGRAAFTAGLGDFAALAAEYTPEKVSQLTGVSPERLAEVTKALAEAKKPLVAVGSELGAGMGAGPIMAGIALNILLGRVGKEGNLVDLPFPIKVIPQSVDFRTMLERDLVAWAKLVASGAKPAPKVLMVYDANPVYALPPDSGVKELIEKSTFTVAMASFMSETCAMCDLVLPASMGAERFDDVYTPYGSGTVTYSLARPVVKTYYDTRPIGEVMLALSRALNIRLGVKDMPELLAKKASTMGANFRAMTESGQVFVGKAENAFTVPVYNPTMIRAALSVPAATTPVHIAPVVVLGMGTAQTAIPPFATKIIMEYQLIGPYSVAQMNGVTAAKLGVRKGDKLKLESGPTAIIALVDIYEGVTPDTVAMSAGLGHTAFDQFSQNKGANIMTLSSVTQEPATGLTVWGGAGVNAVKA